MLDRLAPDLICLTEGHDDFAPPGGHLIAAHPDYGYRTLPGRRKVLLWSRMPWSRVDRLGHPTLPGGRYVAGRTETPAGPLDVIGVCVPWAHAHVTTGRRDRGPWDDHRAFLAGLAETLPEATRGGRSVLLGDLNQSIPRTRAPKAVYDALVRALPEGMRVATAGPIPGPGLPSIDHLAHTADLAATGVRGLPNQDPDGRRLSDHFGLLVELRRGA